MFICSYDIDSVPASPYGGFHEYLPYCSPLNSVVVVTGDWRERKKNMAGFTWYVGVFRLRTYNTHGLSLSRGGGVGSWDPFIYHRNPRGAWLATKYIP